MHFYVFLFNIFIVLIFCWLDKNILEKIYETALYKTYYFLFVLLVFVFIFMF